ncbi:MAG: hypothetical protein ACR2KP_05400 [Egibacteraceae bacterium]
MVFPWLVLAVLFMAPFIDVRRPLRLLHFDLAVLVGLGLPALYSFLSGTELPLLELYTFAGLAYVAGRMLHAGGRPAQRPGPLIPHLPVAWLIVAVVVLLAGRVAYTLVEDRYPVDVGVASAVGADRIAAGKDLYDGGLDRAFFHGDTYGAAMYLTYVPFEQLWPLPTPLVGPDFEGPVAPRAAAMTFDLLVVAALVLLGLRLRPGRHGRELAAALAWAWVAFPYTLLVLAWSFNDALISLLVILALASFGRPLLGSGLAGFAAAAKFAPALLAPLLAAGDGTRSRRQVAGALAVFALAASLPFVPFVAGVELSEVYDRTLGAQQGREAQNTIWVGLGDYDPLQAVCQALVGLLAVVVAFVPRRRTAVQASALAAGLLAALATTMTFWVPMYIVWLAPAAFAALLAEHVASERATPPAAS